MRRRLLLKGTAVSGCLTMLNWPMAMYAQSNGLTSHSLTNRITLVTGAGGNVVLFAGDQAATVVDSGSQEHAEALLSLLEELTDNHMSRLFNTHWHEDHSGGNEAFHAAGIQIISHENTRLWLNADFDVEWRQWRHKPRPAEALPDETFYTSGVMDLGGETVQYHHFPQAHTDGDIVLHFPVSNVMVAGGLLTDEHYPVCDIATGGWIGGLIEANEAMLGIANDATIIVPERGPARSKIELRTQYDMLTDIYSKMKILVQQGFSGHDMLEQKITAEYDDAWGDPTEFVLETYRGMWAHTYDMGGFI